MDIYKEDPNGNPAKMLSEHESSDGRRWVVFESPTVVNSISAARWSKMEDSTAESRGGES